MSIKTINTQGKNVLYIKTIPVAPILSTKQASVDSLSDANIDKKPVYTHSWLPEILELVTDLMDTAENIADRCLGLASTQIWNSSKPCPAIFIMRWPSKDKERGWVWQEFINPVIKGQGKTVKLQEGCLSYPDLVINKKRKSNVTMLYQTLKDPKQQAIKLTTVGHGQLPQIIQHEVDHLNGQCIRSRNFKR